MCLACPWSPARMNLISDQQPFPVLLMFLEFPCHTFSMGGVVTTIYPKPPLTDVGLSAILDITLVSWEVSSGAGFVLQSSSAIHPNSALFYDKNPYSCIFTCVLLTCCETCWQ